MLPSPPTRQPRLPQADPRRGMAHKLDRRQKDDRRPHRHATPQARQPSLDRNRPRQRTTTPPDQLATAAPNYPPAGSRLPAAYFATCRLAVSPIWCRLGDVMLFRARAEEAWDLRGRSWFELRLSRMLLASVRRRLRPLVVFVVRDAGRGRRLPRRRLVSALRGRGCPSGRDALVVDAGASCRSVAGSDAVPGQVPRSDG